MEISSTCLIISAMLSIHPDRSQFFWYDTITLSCEGTDNSGNWTLKRNTSSKTAESCISGWGVSNQTSCTIMDTYASDTGIYWCESDRRECSETINITVTYGVILESPALPVTEDETVTLFCYYMYDEESSATSNFSANFYKDGHLISTQPTGNLTFSAVSLSDEGFYKCEHPAKGQSAQSWMAVKSKVRAQPSVSVPGLIGAILVKLFYTVIITLGANVLIR
ncbi:low affinity immunoglobulin gamma Fc region receptor II-like [Oreochromis aureus]|uniref:low affinity immunoglobulin gamma Fc region receptor II-like n=1 Tax=Oreochromis aureus TaxID=47969 RepID=UPI0012BC6C63|nr:low affinity immunoglobulin gamma Fc region receptor II-like [Oreochromis aureus]